MNTYSIGFLRFFSLALILGLLGCQQEPAVTADGPLFELLTPDQTGVNFINKIEEQPNGFNHLHWDHIYSGAGVAVGDINNDGLPDLFFAGNMVGDALYLNKGDMQFEDITAAAGILQDRQWSAGVTMGDVNGDGFLDIYVCRMGPTINSDNMRNRLYLNNGDNTFTERAKEMNLAHGGYSIQSTFFDYDKDGDLDIYLVNQPPNSRLISRFNLDVTTMGEVITDRLFRNDGDTFTSVTEEAGLFNNAYGLNAIASDLNDDGWPDLYVSNDYGEPDMMYINNQDGTFTDHIHESAKHISFYAMGSDVADFNNDALPDIAVVDMASSDHFRSKTNMGSMQPEVFWASVANGKHYQYMFNTLQLNNGNGSFSDIGQLAGISKTDWSWSILLADFDNDGWQDISITNGIQRDIRNNDFLNKVRQMAKAGQKEFRVMNLVNMVPSNPLPNYFYHNQGDFTFENKAADWGMDDPNFTHGAAYADFDLDGDLDMVMNSNDMEGLIYENRWGNARHYLRVKLTGDAQNRQALNSKVTIKYGDQVQLREATFTRGYLSASEPILHFGLGEAAKIDELTISWFDGTETVLQDVEADQLLSVDYKKVERSTPQAELLPEPLFAVAEAPAFRHQENDFDDYSREILLPHKQSTNGPALASADVNGDGKEDFYVGGAAGQAGVLFLQQADGTFAPAPQQPWSADLGHEDVGALFFDADGDADADLYVASGGSEWAPGSQRYADRLYLNDGQGHFKAAPSGTLPTLFESGQAVAAGDYDSDGDLDLFIGGRIVPGKYPAPANSYLLRNDKGKFTDVTAEVAEGLNPMGLVTDAIFSDYDNDGDADLLMVGEWMPFTVLNNNSGVFENHTAQSGMAQTGGWWWSIAEGDFDGDGDMDYMAGNLGKNAKFKASAEKPFLVYQSDFDENGSNDVVLAGYYKGKQVPVRGRECSSEQMPFIAEKFPTFEGFASASLEDIYSQQSLKKANKREVHSFYSTVFINMGNGQFEQHKLPVQAQFAPVQDIKVTDIDQDGNLDALLVGNLYGAEVETVRYDAGTGLCLMGDGMGGFRALTVQESGWYTPHDARRIALLNGKILIANNNDQLQLFEPRGRVRLQ
ncbi:MAG: VCBS repeat-containing protein [Phaeodactylibacter sp.]|uniref:VCBS repeat-containing protein n=1 Tax=Phaeodactylibacter sp. TaxID=1940289 RepID=UPI0032F06299